jgi:ribosomal-protein-alanine N-acetyltransferase
MAQHDARDVNQVSLLWAAPLHSGEIADLHARLFDRAWSASDVQGLLEHPGASSLVARVGHPKETIGFILVQIAADEAEILSIGVAEEWQRCGLGQRLVEGAERALQRAHVKRLFLEVAEDNAAGLALYAKAGFQEVGRRARYYERKGEPAVDALQLAKDL